MVNWGRRRKDKTAESSKKEKQELADKEKRRG